MARIVEYTAPTKQINPSDRPQAAWETAGRRVGPLYNQAAQDIKQAGAVQGEMERDKIWPFNIYALEASNAPQIRNTTSTETTIRPAAPATTGGARGSVQATGLMLGNGTSQGADYANAYANAGYATTPESAANAVNDWTAAHGEASAGAVGMSRMARAAAAGHSLNPRFVRGGSVDLDTGGTFSGGHDDLIDTRTGNTIGDHAARGDINPSSTLPVDWHDNPYYNGKTLVNGPHGGQYTPHQMDILAEQQANKAYTQTQREYTQAQRKQAVDDRYQRGVDKWNREKAAADKADWNYWNGKNGWNTRRDEWIHGKGGLDDQWQKDYDASIKDPASETATRFMHDHAGEGYDKKAVIRDTMEGMRTQNTYSGTPPRSVTGPPEPAPTPSGVINYLKNTFGSMFGPGDGSAYSSTLEDDNEDEE